MINSDTSSVAVRQILSRCLGSDDIQPCNAAKLAGSDAHA